MANRLHVIPVYRDQTPLDAFDEILVFGKVHGYRWWKPRYWRPAGWAVIRHNPLTGEREVVG